MISKCSFLFTTVFLLVCSSAYAGYQWVMIDEEMPTALLGGGLETLMICASVALSVLLAVVAAGGGGFCTETSSMACLSTMTPLISLVVAIILCGIGCLIYPPSPRKIPALAYFSKWLLSFVPVSFVVTLLVTAVATTATCRNV
jgi:hypothetical protein